jgi:hypothetical protein
MNCDPAGSPGRHPIGCPTLTLFLFLIAFPFQGCSTASSTSLSFEAETDTTGSWRRHDDPMGFTLEHPDTWTLRADPTSGRVRVAAPDLSGITFWPVHMPHALQPANACRIMALLLGRFGLSANWSEPREVGPSTLRSSGEHGPNRLLAIFTWASAPTGASGVLYVVSTPTGRFENPALTRVLGSFRLSSSTAESPRVAANSGTVWIDPTERAFSAEVPAGWRVSGGVARPNSILTQASVEASSPDDGIYLYFGDTFPWFIEPNQFLGPGQIYNDPMGGQSPVWYFLPGGAFVTQYLLPQRLGRFELIEETPRPEVSAGLVRMGMNQFQAGMARYRFHRNGRTHQGAALCVTERMMSGNFATWRVYRLALVEAEEGRLPEGENVLARLVGSFKINPQWLHSEAVKAGVNSRIIAEMSESVSATAAAVFENQQRTHEGVHARGADARREIDRVRDPVTGETYEVSSGSRYYWVDHRGRIVGTETDTIPNIDFRRLFDEQ